MEIYREELELKLLKEQPDKPLKNSTTSKIFSIFLITKLKNHSLK